MAGSVRIPKSCLMEYRSIKEETYFLMQFVYIFPLFQKSAFSLYGLEK